MPSVNALAVVTPVPVVTVSMAATSICGVPNRVQASVRKQSRDIQNAGTHQNHLASELVSELDLLAVDVLRRAAQRVSALCASLPTRDALAPAQRIAARRARTLMERS